MASERIPILWKWICRSSPCRLLHCWHYTAKRWQPSKLRNCCEAEPDYFSWYFGYDKCCHCDTYRWGSDMSVNYSHGKPEGL